MIIINNDEHQGKVPANNVMPRGGDENGNQGLETG
jgi:hypothetical protein